MERSQIKNKKAFIEKLSLVLIIYLLTPGIPAEYGLGYKNLKYGFEITFSKRWQGYKVFKKITKRPGKFQTTTFHIALPTKSTRWHSFLKPGYASVFAITAFTYNQYFKLRELPENIGLKCGSNNVYVFTLSYGNASPPDLDHMRQEKDYEIVTFNIDPSVAGKEYYTPTINNLRFRKQPNLKGKFIRKLKKGEKLTLIKKGETETIQGVKGTWIQVRTKKNETGWCFDAYLKKL